MKILIKEFNTDDKLQRILFVDSKNICAEFCEENKKIVLVTDEGEMSFNAEDSIMNYKEICKKLTESIEYQKDIQINTVFEGFKEKEYSFIEERIVSIESIIFINF